MSDDTITLGVEWTNRPGPRPYVVVNRADGRVLGTYATWEQARAALPKLARKLGYGKEDKNEKA